MKTQHGHAAPLTVSPTTHKPFAGLRALVRTVAVLGLFMAAVPLPAAADSCKPLLKNLVLYLQQTPSSYIEVVHTTNYQANGYWAGAYSSGVLWRSTSEPRLYGDIYRDWDDGRQERFEIEFYTTTGQVRFAGQYGPYPTNCIGNKFLTVNTGDSFETFTFEKHHN